MNEAHAKLPAFPGYHTLVYTLSQVIHLIGSWHYNIAYFSRLVSTIRAVPEQLEKLISHRFPLERVSEAWDLQATG